jgi:hypothetical protein
MHRVRRFIEVGSGRVGYAMTAKPLSDISDGAQWDLDPSFNVADTILSNPAFAEVLRVVLRDGRVIVPEIEGVKKE